MSDPNGRLDAVNTLDQMIAANDRMRDAARSASDAAEGLARTANGTGERVIPAATVYDLLGEVKVLLWNLKEVIDYLPNGLQASLADPRFDVYDRTFTGEPRDHLVQAAIASDQLHDVAAALAQAARAAEAAQTTLNGQGYDEKHQ